MVIRNREILRARQITALLTELELPELIAHTKKEYIELSIPLATDKKLYWDYRDQIQQKILSNPEFLDCHGYAKQIGALLKKLLIIRNQGIKN